MSKLLLLYGYNNYFNRIIKREENFSDYKSQVGTGYYAELENTNFNITDGVNARHVFNISSFLDEKSPDYLVREKANGELERWFVLESVKIMGNQIQLTLRRDIIADYFDQIKVSPAFIQKGNLQFDSPLIFNKEGLTFNQIKKKEILIKDKTKSSWVVGYLARGSALDQRKTITGYSDAIPGLYGRYEDLDQTIKSAIENQTTITDIKNSETYVDFYTQWLTDFYKKKGFWTRANLKDKNVSVISNENKQSVWRSYICLSTSGDYDEQSIIINGTKSEFYFLNFLNVIKSYYGFNKDKDISLYENKIYIKDNKAYHLKFTLNDITNYDKDLYKNDMTSNSLGLEAKDFVTRLVGYNTLIKSYPEHQDTDQKIFGVHIKLKNYKVSLVPADIYTSETHIANSTTISGVNYERNRVKDAPYDMFAIPMNENIKVIVGSSGNEININSTVALPIARGFKESLADEVYDIQILPYCPFPEIVEDETIDTRDLILGKDYEFIRNKANDEIISIVVFPRSSAVSFDVELNTEENPELNISEDSITRKIEAETKICRICSPNYNGMFEFSPQKNNGCRTLKVDVNFKPYTPYIHVSPYFSGLYGDNFNDARGLICGGDFSISTASSKWAEYQIQNKNFENIFDRQIQNMDVNNSISMEKAKYTATIGAITAGISSGVGGAIAGSAGGPAGAVGGFVVGATAGAITSAIGGAKDIQLLSKQQSENRDYAVDMYTYQIGNIQALPYNLTKVSAFNKNNKIFPFIEIYDCTDIEKQNLRDKIKYNGMTVMVQGKIEDYIINDGDYIEAQMIRIEGIYEDNHLITEIYNEMMKGIYVYGRDTEGS